MSFRRSVAWAFLGQFISAAVGFGSSIIIARLLTPYEFGLNAVAVATSGILAVIASSGADAFIVREVNLTRQVIATATTVNALLYTILSLILLGISFASDKILGDENVAHVLRILAIMPLLNIVTFRPAAMLQRDMRFKAAAVVVSASVIVNNGVTIAAILLGGSYISPAIGAVSGLLFTIILYAIINPYELRMSFSTKGIRKMVIFGIRMVSISGAAQFVQHASQIILGRMLGINSLDLYSRATTLANFLFSQAYGTAARITFSRMSQEFRDTGEISEIYLKSFYIITSVMWPVLLILSVLSKPVIALLYGEQWTEASAPFSVLMVAQIIVLGFAMNWELFVIRDKVAVQTRYELLRAAIGLATFAMGCMFGMTAAALGRLADALIGFIFYFSWMSRLSGARRSEIVAIQLRSAGLALAAAVPSATLMLTHGWDAAVPIPLLLGSVLTGILAWVTLLWWLSHPLLHEIRMVLTRLCTLPMGRPFASLSRTGRADAAVSPQPEDRMPIDERF